SAAPPAGRTHDAGAGKKRAPRKTGRPAAAGE
ncbi:MAG: hypothetical protein JWP97_4871, partial [Labilithrix sp.]|nr:hypothetical protein [Labilithrix sp.]